MQRPTSILSMVIRMRNIILRYGWVRDIPGDIHQGFCIGAAMRHAIMNGEGPNDMTQEDHELLMRTYWVLDRAAGVRCGRQDVVWWNDRVAQSKQQVINFLNDVIQEEKAVQRATI